MNLRLINNHSHPILTMAFLRLRTINPNRFGIIHCEDKLHGSQPNHRRLKAGEEAICERSAGSLKAALHDGVVLGIVAEGKGIARSGGDDLGVKVELVARADGNGDVGCKSEGKEGEQREKRTGVHDDGSLCLLFCTQPTIFEYENYVHKKR